MKCLKRIYVCGLLLAASGMNATASQNVVERVKTDGDKSLTKAEAVSCGQQLLTEWKNQMQTGLKDAYTNKQLIIGKDTMKVAWSIYGEKPQDGYALYISLHGGGGTTPEVNDGQWDNQKRLYKPEHAVYLSPRAIANTWDMHFLPQTDAFYRQIIMMMTVWLDVNPNKVYLMGYSAGGDGVWRLAPRLVDSWAAASMMAGHPGDVSLVNLRNTPFSIWCGAEDAAYERNLRCQERIDEMKALHEADPGGYIYDGHIVAGKGHWMDREDTVAVKWMGQYVRHPYPEHVVWQQEEVLQQHFYWITAPKDELARGKKVIVDINGNTIDISQCDYSTLTISLCDNMVDLDKPVKIIWQGKTVFEGRLERKLSTLRRTLYERNDPAYMFAAQVQVFK